MKELKSPPLVTKLLKKFRRPVVFSLVGLTNPAVDLLVFTLLYTLLHRSLTASQFLGYCAGTLNSFLLNRRITFKGTVTIGLGRQMGRYLLSCGVALGLTLLLLHFFHGVLHLGAFLAKLCAMALVFFFNYFCMKRFVFSPRRRPGFRI